MQIAQVAQRRYTTKAFDPSRQISADDLAAIRTLLRNAASSVNSQPWHFVIASSEAGKGAIAETLKTGYAYNEGKVRNASQVVVFCARKTLDAAHLNAVLAQEEADGRFATPDAKAANHKGRTFFADMHRKELKDDDQWMAKQVYLNVGNFLLGVAAMGLDAVPIEGVDFAILDEEFDLKAKGYTSLVVVPVGHHSVEDFNATLPKSRLPQSTTITEI